MSQQSGGVKTRAFKAAFPKVLPRIVDYLGNVFPYAMTGLLVVYSLRNVNPLAGGHGIPEAIAIAVIVILHMWKRNILLSIAGGTAIYMVLLQLVFV
ncbi:MAG: branched-chain amino acid transporter permease [Bifidobacterium catenulatum]